MLYSKKSLLYYATILSLLLAPACQCKKETTAPGKPPEIPKDSHLVTAIRINNVPKDSLVYNDQQQVIQRWDYNTTYRIWQNYTTYQYNKDGFVTSAAYYNENDNTLKSLSQRDSIVWTPGKLIIYTTNYRELGTEISGYDTTRMELNSSQQLTLLGSRDTVLLNFPPSKGLYYTDYQYDGNNIRQYTDMSYIIAVADPTSGILFMDRFEMEYNQVRNPLYKLVAKNPLLFRQLIGDHYQLSINHFYPFLGSERYVTNVKYQSEAVPLTSAPVTYKMVNGTSYAQTQTLAALNMVVSYSYKVVKID